MLCLTGVRYNMTALVLVQGADTNPNTPSVVIGIDEEEPLGHETFSRDPFSGAPIRVWVPATPDDNYAPTVPVNSGTVQGRRINCMVRGMINNNIRGVGTGETFAGNGLVTTVDYATMKFPADVVLTARDRVTDIRNRQGTLLWKEEESDDSATIFQVVGVTPVVDPFGNYIENSTLLQRVDIQNG